MRYSPPQTSGQRKDITEKPCENGWKSGDDRMRELGYEGQKCSFFYLGVVYKKVRVQRPKNKEI